MMNIRAKLIVHFELCFWTAEQFKSKINFQSPVELRDLAEATEKSLCTNI